ncbi:MAG: hypothetical protein IPN10_18225 [Saprospiraceae bacterium]|nr:hypothetical protein [Saprospiraceae bacterium]
MSEKEKIIMQESVMEIYDLFLNRVSTGRKLSVWTALKSLQEDEFDRLQKSQKPWPC